MGRKLRDPVAKRREFLDAYGQTGNITLAAEMVGIDRRTHYDWMRDDPDYPADFAEAREVAGERLEGEAFRRAVKGWEEPVYQGGQQVGTIRRYDSRILLQLLRANLPEKFGDKVEHSHDGGLDIVVRYVGETED